MNLKMLKKAMLAYVSAVKFIWSEIAYPLSIVGKKLMNLRGYRIYGNSVQDGTPTPDNPIEIENVGDLTKNLFDKDKEKYNVFVDSDMVISKDNYYTIFIDVENISNFTISIKKEIQAYYGLCDSIEVGSEIYEHNYFGKGLTRTVTNNTHKYVGISIYYTNISALDDVQIEEGTTATDYEPYHKYKIPVVARGKNLIPKPTFSSFTKNGVKFTNNKDGTITINGTPTAFTSIPNMYLPDSTLEILRNNVCVLTGFYYYEKNISFALSIGLNGNWIKYIYLNPYTYKNYVKVDLTNVEFDTVVLTVRSQNVGVLIDNLTVKPFLEVGTTMPTSFEPYITPVTTNIFLDEPLRKVGDYADYIDFEKQKVVRNVEVLDDTGTKTIDESLGVINPPAEETVNLPALPQFKGTTIYEVGTNIKPSGMEAKYC